MNPIVKTTLLSFVFVVLTVTVFCGVQWFSDSVGNLLIDKNTFPASLQIPNDNVIASAGPSDLEPYFMPLPTKSLENPALEARAAISITFDGNDQKELFSQNKDEIFPVASLAKLMTALVVLERYDLSQSVKISKIAMEQEGVQGVLKEGEVLSVKNLLYISLIESSNRAAFALSEIMGQEAFVVAMNDAAKRMSLTHTHFSDATGLSASSYSTASDLAVLSEYLFRNYPIFKEIISLKEYNLYLPNGILHHKLENTNEFLGKYNVIGGKTGFTNEALGCFMTIQQDPQQGEIINIILGAKDRFVEMQKLMEGREIK